jgi:hypothetical protein
VQRWLKANWIMTIYIELGSPRQKGFVVSSSYTPADPFQDSYQSTPYILEKLKKCGDDAESGG